LSQLCDVYMHLVKLTCLLIWSASLKLMPRFGMPFRNAFAVRLHHKPEGFFCKSQVFFRELESFFSEEVEGFFRRVLGLCTHKFPKRGAASLTYLPRSHLGLPHSCLGLPHLCLFRNSGPATGFRITASILKTRTTGPFCSNSHHQMHSIMI